MGFHIRGVLHIAVNILLVQTVWGNFIFPSFDQSFNELFTFKNSNIVRGALQVTEETLNPDPKYSMQNRSGRVIYNTPYRLWKKDGAASFNVTFVMNIQGINNRTGGEGMAFFISSKKDINDIPGESHGQWLGLFNSSIDGLQSNEMVAVEFDTMKSDGTNDPDGNHVGINVNTINSTKIQSLDESQINLKSGDNIMAWIQYNGVQQQLNVYLANSPDFNMPVRPILSDTLNFSGVLDSEIYFGFSASTGVSTELNCILSWSLSIEPVMSPSKRTFLLVLCSVAAVLVVAATVIIIVLYMKRRRSRVEIADLAGALQNLPGHPREFKYKDLKKATGNFSAESQLGSGAFGSVYKAILSKEKPPVAVKRMFKDANKGKQEFVTEISIINRLRHRNLVPLLGWCHDNGQLMMVYEYMPNGSLEKHIYRGFLDWEQRYKIVSGVASALVYLHEECEQQVIHRDLKASNVMLDTKYEARLGDFGLARLIEHNQNSYRPTDVAGTLGYIAPECFHMGRATVESDVFGFGAVALEVVCGRSPKFGREEPDLVGWVWKLYRENKLMEAADSRMPANSINEEDIKCLLMVGLACSNPNPGDRPTMRQVKQILCKEMSPPSVPLFRPPFIWPHPVSDDSSFSQASTYTQNGSEINSMALTSVSTENGSGTNSSVLGSENGSIIKSLIHATGSNRFPPEVRRNQKRMSYDLDSC